jgi:hypothetical protein
MIGFFSGSLPGPGRDVGPLAVKNLLPSSENASVPIEVVAV